MNWPRCATRHPAPCARARRRPPQGRRSPLGRLLGADRAATTQQAHHHLALHPARPRRGIAGLDDRPRRGRLPTFSICHPYKRPTSRPRGCFAPRTPAARGDRTRSTLDATLAVSPSLLGLSRSCVRRVLETLDVFLQRGLEPVLSPVTAYDAKRAAIVDSVAAVRASDGQVVALFLDEVTLYRQPNGPRPGRPGAAPAACGARLRADAPARIVGSLDIADGRVLAPRRGSRPSRPWSASMSR